MKLWHNAKPKSIPPRIRIDLTGQTFGLWTVLGFWDRKRKCLLALRLPVRSEARGSIGNLRSGRSNGCSKLHPRSRSTVYQEHRNTQFGSVSASSLCEAVA